MFSNWVRPALATAGTRRFCVGRVWLVVTLLAVGRLTAANATINLDTPALTFTATAGGADPATQTVNLTDSGPGGTTLNWTAMPDQPWLTVAPISGATTTGTDVLTIGCLQQQTEQWTTTTAVQNAPTARCFHTAVWTGREMIVWGGHDNTNPVDTGGRYDPTTDSWLAAGTTTTSAPEARYYHTAVWTGKEMIVWGGSGVGGLLNTGGRYDPATDSWTAITTTNAPSPRGDQAAVWTGTEMIVWSGWNGTSDVTTGGRYNPSTDTWTAMSTANAPTAREAMAAVWTGTEMIVWGGISALGDVNTGGRYNPATDSWSVTPLSTVNAPSRRDSVSAVWTGGEMLVWGGEFASTKYGSGGRYNPVTDRWSDQPTLTTGAPAARYAQSAIWTGSEMIVWGGVTQSAPVVSDGKRYHPGFNLAAGVYTGHVTVADPLATNSPQVVTVSFSVTGPAIQLSAATLAFAASTGSSNPTDQTVNLTNSGPGGTTLNWTAISDSDWLTVAPAGGSTTTGTDPLTIGVRLQPLEAWPTATATAGAPSARGGAVTVWTGTEMIVWGGSNGGPLGDGGRYNPATNTWSAMSAVNAPSARQNASAVWTGTAMIVWGGADLATRFNDGGRYDPVTDTWSTTPLSTTNAPTKRSGQSAVWTGTEMIVWGGADFNGSYTYFNDGGRYDPATDTWSATPLATTNAPTARRYHTAVWTGTEMIVWGGDNAAGNAENTGGRYTPGTNSWSATPPATTNAPTARENHTAVWTGSEMIVWGGWGGPAGIPYTNTGGRYNPTTDTWLAAGTTTVNAPPARAGQAAVWTGSAMIVWGGSDLSIDHNDGMFYQLGRTLPAGSYTGHVIVADPLASNNPQAVAVTFTVNAAPVVLSAASATPNPVVNAYTTAVTITANDPDSGPAALTYTWSKVSGPAAVSFSPNATTGAANSTATFTTSGTYTLQVSVSDSAAAATSQIVGLVVTVPVAVSITTDPADQTVQLGQTATFSVAATGTPAPTYQWRKNTVPIGGATGSSYTTPATTAGNSGAQFDVVVTNPAGPVTSNAATLTVAPPVAPAITAIPGGASLTVSWSAVPYATTYTVYYATQAGVTAANYGSLTGGTRITNASSPEVLGGLTPGTTYYCMVTASNAAGESTASNEASATPLFQPYQLVFGVAPSTQEQVGQAFSFFTVEIRDAGNALVTGNSSTQITVSRAGGTGVLSGTTTVTAVNGVAVFEHLTYDRAETFQLGVTANPPPTVGFTPVAVSVQAGPAAGLPIIRANLSPSGAQADSDARYDPGLNAVSADGRYIVFHSNANNLVAGDANSHCDVFRRDRLTGVTALVSVATGGQQGNAESYAWGGISPNGRFVVFYSLASNLAAGDTNGVTDVFVRDMQKGTTELITVSSAGAVGIYGGATENMAISDDGRYVTFFSASPTFVAGDTNGCYDGFLRDRLTGQTTRISNSAAGVEGNFNASRALICGDGSKVAFETSATNTAPGDTNGVADIYVRDLTTGTVTRASCMADGTIGNQGSFLRAVSRDGNLVVFESASTNWAVVPGNGAAVRQILLKNMTTGVLEMISQNTAGQSANAACQDASVSADGRYVAFRSQAHNLATPPVNNGVWNVFVRDRQTGFTHMLWTSAGQWPNGDAETMHLSADGRYLSVLSLANNMLPGDTNGYDDLFVCPNPVKAGPISFSVTGLSLTAAPGSTTPVVRTLTMTNQSAVPITVTPATVAGWIALSSPVTIPAGGTATLTVSADPTGLTGANTATVTVTNSSGEVTSLPVTLTLLTPAAGAKKSGCMVGNGSNGGAAEWTGVVLALLAGGWALRQRQASLAVQTVQAQRPIRPGP